MKGRQGLLGRAFDVCVAIFIAALLLHFAVQLVEGIKWWLVGGMVVAVVAAVAAGAIRYRRDRW
jgi:hypothetical protein